MTTKQDKQPNARKFERGDRIIYNGQFIGTLLEPSGCDDNLHWKVQWEDGAETANVYPEADMVFANGGPDSGQRGLRNIRGELAGTTTEWGIRRDADSACYSKEAAERTYETQRKRKLKPILIKRQVGPWEEA